jgi:class 3 adenylate cyclase
VVRRNCVLVTERCDSVVPTFPDGPHSNAGLPPDRRIEFRVGIHLGDVVEEAGGWGLAENASS